MAYFKGQSTETVKPVRRRITFPRGKFVQTKKVYLQKRGRPPINYFAHPTMGTPVMLDLSRNPGQDQLGGALFIPSGNAAGIDLTSSTPVSYNPSIPVPSSSQQSSGGFFSNLINGVVSLWNNRPAAMQGIGATVQPWQLMQAAQRVVSPNQVGGFVDQLRQWGVQPTYNGMPITGSMAQYGYQYAGSSWSQYLPYILAGGAALLVLPMIMKR